MAHLLEFAPFSPTVRRQVSSAETKDQPSTLDYLIEVKAQLAINLHQYMYQGIITKEYQKGSKNLVSA